MTKEELKGVKSGELLTTKYGNILLVSHIDMSFGVRVYHYFDWDKDCGILMNEWLHGFYGPKFDDNFYRYSTEEEKKAFLSKLNEYGYVLEESYGKLVPRQTFEESQYHRFKILGIPDIIERDAQDYADCNSKKWEENGDVYYDHDKLVNAYMAGAKKMAQQGSLMIVTECTKWEDIDSFIHRNCDGASYIQIHKK